MIEGFILKQTLKLSTLKKYSYILVNLGKSKVLFAFILLGKSWGEINVLQQEIYTLKAGYFSENIDPLSHVNI